MVDADPPGRCHRPGAGALWAAFGGLATLSTVVGHPPLHGEDVARDFALLVGHPAVAVDVAPEWDCPAFVRSGPFVAPRPPPKLQQAWQSGVSSRRGRRCMPHLSPI